MTNKIQLCNIFPQGFILDKKDEVCNFTIFHECFILSECLGEESIRLEILKVKWLFLDPEDL